MDIAEKVIRAKQDLDNVYAAGQSSMVDESKLIPKTVSGAYISVDDVSEIPHSVGCKVESVNVWHGNSEYSIVGNGAVQAIYQDYSFKGQSCPMSISCEVASENLEYSATGNLVYFHVMYEDGTADILTLCGTTTTSGNISKQFNADGAKVIHYLTIFAHNRFTSGTVTLSNIMFNKGTTALPYTPYVKPEEVKVTRCGNNLARYPYSDGTVTRHGVTFTDNGDGSITFNGTATAVAQFTFQTFQPNKRGLLRAGTYTISNNHTGIKMQLFLYATQDTSSSTNSYTLTNSATKTFTITEDRYYGFLISVSTGETADNLTIKPMLNIGTTALPYEPYTAQTLTPATDGTVEGMTSVSPYMNVFSDTEGVNIEATYNKSYGMQTEYDRFWDAFQDYGNRTDYQSAFRRWGFEAINPRYQITPSTIYELCAYSPKLKQFNWNKVSVGKVSSAYFAFNECQNLQSVDITIEPSSATPASTFWTGTFRGCNKLKTIQKLITVESAVYSYTFEACSSLENVIFEGVIGKSISFQWCPLTKASITNVINTLSSTVTGQTLTLNLSAVNTAFETSSGAADGSTSAEFAALVATKTNWTITMI